MPKTLNWLGLAMVFSSFGSTFSMQSSSSASRNIRSKRLFIAIELPEFIRQVCKQTIEETLLPLDACSSFPQESSNNEKKEVNTKSSATVRWVLDQSMYHCTLQFLGQVPENSISELSQSLSESCRFLTPITLKLGNLGCFPSNSNLDHVRVIKFELETYPKGESANHCKLQELAEVVMTSTESLGYKREKRSFQPHVTLGRVRTDTASPRKGKHNRRKRQPTLLASPLKQFLGQSIESNYTSHLGFLDEGDNELTFEVDRISLIHSTVTKEGPAYVTLEYFQMLGQKKT